MIDSRDLGVLLSHLKINQVPCKMIIVEGCFIKVYTLHVTWTMWHVWTG